MFIVLHLPFVDLRGLHEGAFGRSPRPNWQVDNPGDCFVRNFGGMVTRNAKSYGLLGERAYVEFEHALVFPQPGGHRQAGWSMTIPLRLWFRRLYFDGDVSGRFEVGFHSDHRSEEDLFLQGAAPYQIPLLARSVNDIPVEVRSADGSKNGSTLERCGKNLGLAFLAATTLHAKRNDHPPAELYGKAFKVGSPTLHVRVCNDVSVAIPQDRRDIVADGDDRMFLTSIANSQRRNTVTVQLSPPYTGETPDERARRVLFAHLASVLHANDFLSRSMDARAAVQHRVNLKELIARALSRFGSLAVTAPRTDGDAAFAGALKLFADQNAGRIDDVVAKLDALAKDASAPSRLERIGGWTKGWTEFFADAAINASVKAMMAATS
jgi:hypothetical protein